MPWPSSMHLQARPGRRRATRVMVISEPAGAYFAALSSRLNSTCSNSTVVQSSIGRSGCRSTCDPVRRQDLAGAPQRAADHVGQFDRAGARLQRAGLQPRHVQQVADETVQPLGLFLDGARSDRAASPRPAPRPATAGWSPSPGWTPAACADRARSRSAAPRAADRSRPQGARGRTSSTRLTRSIASAAWSASASSSRC